MIHANKCIGFIKGKGIDILEEYTSISHNLLHNDPEMFIAVHMAFIEEAMELLPQIDEKKLDQFIKLAEHLVEKNKESEDKK